VVSHPKRINIKQYFNTSHFSVNNRRFVIKYSQVTQLYITKVFYKQFSCHGSIKHHFFSEILIKLRLSHSVQSHDQNRMQHDTSDIIFYAFKNTFVMKSFICFTNIFIYLQFSCHEFIKKSIFITNIDKMNHF